MRMTKIAHPRTKHLQSSTRGSAVRRLPISRRIALVSAVAVLGLTACGSSESATNGSGSTAVSLPAPAVIRIAGGAGGAGAAPAAAGDASMEASTKMMPAMLTYEWTGEATDLTGPAASWFFAGDVEPTVEQIQQLAAALGVTGEVVALGEDMGGGWTIGPNDGTAPSITVSADAMQSWWYSPAWAESTPMVDCAYYPPGDPAGDPATADLPQCEEPQPPANVPTQAEAEAKARELFASLGIDPAQLEFETYADQWSASVTAYLLLDGVRSNLGMNVGFGGEGAVTWAGGFLATPQRGADYPRIGVDAAIERLNDQSMLWMTGAVPMARSGVAGVGTDVAVASEGGVVEAETSSGSAATPAMPPVEPPVEPTDTTAPAGETEIAPDATVLIDEMPVECTDPAVSCLPSDPMEPIVVVLTEVTPSLEQVWADDGTVWLLPGYLFGGDEGAMASVLAVEDQYLVQAAPQPVPLPEPMPVETAVPGTDVVAPNEGEGEPAMPTPGFEVSIVGLTLDEATKLAEQSGWTVRVARENGVDLALTMDLVETRVNVAVEDGVITEVLNIG